MIISNRLKAFVQTSWICTSLFDFNTLVIGENVSVGILVALVQILLKNEDTHAHRLSRKFWSAEFSFWRRCFSKEYTVWQQRVFKLLLHKGELKVHISNKKKCNFLYFVFFCVLHFVFCIYFKFLKIKAALLHQDWVESFDLQYNYCYPFNLHFFVFCIL